MRAGQRLSLFWRLLIGMVAVGVIAVGVASLFLYIRFGNADSQFREGTLRTYARSLSRMIRATPRFDATEIPPALIRDIQENEGRIAILDGAGKLLYATPGTRAPLATPGTRPREFFTLKQGNRQEFGLSVETADAGGSALWVQVAFPENSVIFDSILEEFIQDIAWIWIPFVFVLLAVNVLIARYALRPLRLSAQQAELIGPTSVATRLPEAGMPSDVLALVRAVNRAFDRLQEQLRIQDEFVSDAAHELRTPLSIIRAQLASAQDTSATVLKQDVAGMERLVEQLLDRARLGGMHVESGDQADLSELSRHVAEYLAPMAIARNRSIEVLGAERPILVNGLYDYLFRAVRNLAENALDHTPAGTTITIAVSDAPALSVIDRGPGVPPAERSNVLRRFWQGRRDRSRGAGIGLSIVQDTIAGHHGRLDVLDAQGGGAEFRLQFPRP